MVVASHHSASSPSIGTLIARAKSTGNSSRARSARGEPIRVVLADDSYLMREALEKVLAPLDAIELVAIVQRWRFAHGSGRSRSRRTS